jgi:hypothetical protein
MWIDLEGFEYSISFLANRFFGGGSQRFRKTTFEVFSRIFDFGTNAARPQRF